MGVINDNKLSAIYNVSLESMPLSDYFLHGFCWLFLSHFFGFADQENESV